MSATFKNARYIGTSTLATAYTCPASTVAIVLGLQVANVDTANHNSQVLWKDYSNSNAITRLMYNVAIPAGASIGCLEGKLVLEANDYIQVYSDVDSKLEYSISVLEISV